MYFYIYEVPELRAFPWTDVKMWEQWRLGPDCTALPEASLFAHLQWADDAFLVNIYHGEEW